jgi:hypothetical protein
MASRAALPVALALALVAGGAQAALRQFSYDPADAATRTASGPVTLLISQSMFGVKVLKLRSTEAKATVDLARADPGRLPDPVRGTPYRIRGADDGPAFTAALCPGSKQAWLAVSPVRYGADLQMAVVGDDPSSKALKLCRLLRFSFHGEWRLPSGASPKLEADEAPDFPK